MPIDLTIKGAEKLRAMAVALRAADKALPRKLRRAINDAAQPTLRNLRQAARDIRTRGEPKPGRKHAFRGPSTPKGLREKIANAIVIDVKLGDDPKVAFRVDTSKLPENIQVMPRKFDQGGTFRHPVMGNREVWVSQTGDPWFWPPIRDNIKTFRAEIDKALEETRAEIERG
jgi:hypothetical protein